MRTNNKKREKKQTNKKLKYYIKLYVKFPKKKRLKIWYTDKKEYTY